MTSQLLNPPELVSPLQTRRFLPGLLVLFVGSGCAALIYEIVWLQQLGLIIGSSAISLGVLLGVFMGGMCLGSLILPRLISARRHPLRVYAWLEILIGICGLAIIGFGDKSGIHYVEEWYTTGLSAGTQNIWARAAVSGICLLLPTMLMGATLPAISRWVESTPEGVSWMGFFYGGNIVGAVFGCLLAGFYLLPHFNMPIATYIAAAINFSVAAIALALASQTPHDPPETKIQDIPLDEPAENGAVYIVIALSGLAALGAEVVWTRLLSLLLGGTVYTFSIILAVFLVGLGIGSSVGASAARNTSHPRRALGLCQALLVGAIAWAAWSISKSLPFWPVDPQTAISEAMRPYRQWYTFQLDLMRTAYAVLPGAILWGASFPLALASVATRGRDPGKMVGGVYAANTVGAIVGAMTFSLFVVPMLHPDGAQKALIVVAAISALMALVPYLFPKAADEFDSAGAVPGTIFATVFAVVVGLLIWSVSPAPWMLTAFGRVTSQNFTSADPFMYTSLEDWQKNSDKYNNPDPKDTTKKKDNYSRFCIFVGDGMNVSVAVTMNSSGTMYFHGAGKVQASTEPQDMRLQRMLGHVSVLGQRKPDEVTDVLVVACGAGVTAGSFVPYPNVKNITICDIEPFVPTKVTPKFSSVNYRITDDITVENSVKQMDGKRIEVVFDDGRHYIHTLPEDKKYDIITSDPIDPWVKGCAALNTVQYYEMCKKHLKPGGVMSLWIPLYESNTDTAKSVIGTFFSVFKNGILFSNDYNGDGYDAVLFGTADDAPQINLDEVQKLLDTEAYKPVKQSLMDVGFGSKGGDQSVAVELMGTFAAQGKDLQGWMDKEPKLRLNTDRDLSLQYLAGMSLNSYLEKEILNEIFHYYRFPDQVFTGSAESVDALKRVLERDGRTKYGARVGSP